MSAQRFIYQHLKENGKVSAIVGDRIYPLGEVDETVKPPYVTFQRISNVHERHLNGGTGLAHPRWEINVWARGALENDNLAEAIREAMDNFSGDVDTGAGTFDVRSVFLEDDEQDFEPSFDGSGRGVWRTRMDFIIWHGETITP
jgi:hypothetical protein